MYSIISHWPSAAVWTAQKNKNCLILDKKKSKSSMNILLLPGSLWGPLRNQIWRQSDMSDCDRKLVGETTDEMC